MERNPLIDNSIKDSVYQRAKNRIRRSVASKMFGASTAVVVGEIGRSFYEATLIGQKDINPGLDIVAHHMGDFSFFALAELLFYQTLFSGIKNPTTRRNASLVGGLGLLAMAEVPQLNDFITGLIHLPLLGTPDLVGDAPAGIVGLAAWYLVRRGVETYYTKRYEKEAQQEIQKQEASAIRLQQYLAQRQDN